MIQLRGIDHCTIRVRPQDVDAMGTFYGGVVGLVPGPRPDFSFPGLWLYLDAAAVVHVAGVLDPLGPPAPNGAAGSTGQFDHVSFRTENRPATETHLRARGVPFQGTPVPGTSLYQLFFYDPAGLKIELTFYDEPATNKQDMTEDADATEAEPP